MENEKLALANNIKILRKARGLNQEALANALNIKRSNIAAYETKNVEPRLRIILDIAKFFDIDISTLLSEKLTENSEYESFLGSEKTIKQVPVTIDVDSANVNEFVKKSISIKKILVGFKAFYSFRKSKLAELSPKNEKIIFDIDNFIQLMEDLINHNEAMINLLSTSKK